MAVPAPHRVLVYADEAVGSMDARAVADHVRRTIGVRVTLRGGFLVHHARRAPPDLASRLAATRVTDLLRPNATEALPPAFALFEERFLTTPDRFVPGVLYDGFRLQAVLRALLPPPESRLGDVHLAFTSRLLGTFDDADRRYHARALIMGYPNLVSASGLVEGPAKPRGFYAAKRGLGVRSADARYEAIKAEFAGRFLDYGDERLTEVAKGYALQAVFHQATGEAFCPDPDCVLYNAHWQEEMLHAQVESGLLCARHRKVAESWRGGARSVTDGRRTRRRG